MAIFIAVIFPCPPTFRLRGMESYTRNPTFKLPPFSRILQGQYKINTPGVSGGRLFLPSGNYFHLCSL